LGEAIIRVVIVDEKANIVINTDAQKAEGELNKLKNFLICFSVGNLCFLRRWYDLEHLKERSMDYYRTGPADLTLLGATLVSAYSSRVQSGSDFEVSAR
jgi:hypothetical protein